ncbi:MAG: glycine--tRNA ligase subunit beta [Candidatus Goldbacteria bacterium]|nr:glycine--tRNA ligase subunit beta [Candidatus Goldiibacteriota bacterium]
MDRQKSKTNVLLLELGFEELPADYLKPAAEQILENTKKMLEEKNVDYKEAEVFWTVRRMILRINGMSEKQKDVRYVKKGPRYDIAYKEGRLTEIGRAFMEKNDFMEKDVKINEENGQKYLFADVFKKGESTQKVLSESLPEIIKNIRFPKSMVWDDTLVQFARPLRWILCLFNDKPIKFRFGRIVSSNKSRLHKYENNNKKITVRNAEEYFKILEKNHILTDQNQRKNEILMEIDRMLSHKKLKLLKDDELLEKVAGSVEMTSVMMGEFDKKYLFLPDEVIITAMREHQRYFAVLNEDDRFTNYFINVRDGSFRNNDFIVKQHSKVLLSRLNDASFFYRDDLKQPLEKNVERLKEAVFITNLGNMYQKVERLENYSKSVNDFIKYGDTDDLVKIAHLCKADLMTEMIGEKEFVGLRGFMGGVYLREQGYDEKIWKAVMEHYKPEFAGDKLPETMEGALISLFDKIDNLCGYFIAGFKPSGSKDPYAVRRQALNIIYLITEKEMDVSLAELIEKVKAVYNSQFAKTFDTNEITEFLKQRQINYLKDKSIDYDVINSVLESTPLAFSDNLKKAEVLMQARKEKDFNDVIFAISRINNIIPVDYKPDAVNEEHFDSDREKNLYYKFKANKDEIKNKINKKEYKDAFELIASFRAEIDDYFKNVLVNTDDEVKRKNRLNMLYEIRQVFMNFADFSKIIIDRK